MSLGNGTTIRHLTNIRENIGRLFDLNDLKNLAFDLAVDLDEFPEGKSAKIREMLILLDQQDRILDLLERLKAHRPQIVWDNFLPDEPDARSPYMGLQYFSEDNQRLFFGRDKLTKKLVERLEKERFLVIVGASGSGKSSLVRAGLIPAVRRGEVKNNGRTSQDWPVHIITPTDQPLNMLASTLTREELSTRPAKTLAADLREDEDGNSLNLYLMRQPDNTLLLVVDQFEELFTQCSDKIAQNHFVNNLVNAVQAGEKPRLKLILTLRADFYGQAVQFERLNPLLETGQQIVVAMNRIELGEAILKPAVTEGWRFQNGLVEQILDDVGSEPGALPLLSHALQETWERREGRRMTLAGYQSAGGVRGAIANTADNVLTDLPEPQQKLAQNIFLRLTELGEGTEDTRRRVRQSELIRRSEERETISALLQKLAAARLITTDTLWEQTGGAREVVEVSHEALIREWPTLRGWLDENRQWLRSHRQLTESAENWDANQRDTSYLYRDTRLAQIAEWVESHEEELNELERAFITAGLTLRDKETEERERLRQLELELAQKKAEEAEARRLEEVERAKNAEKLAEAYQAQAKAVQEIARRTRMLLIAVLALMIVGGFFLRAPLQNGFRRLQARARPLIISESNNVPLGTSDFENSLPDGFYNLPTFMIEQTEVTNKKYNLCVEAGVCVRPGFFIEEEQENYPVVNISAVEASEYCHWVGRQLPTDLEWERVARYTDGRPWPWGDDQPTADRAHFGLAGEEIGSPQEVGLTRTGVSPEGVYDLAGNVWEFTRSNFDFGLGDWSGLLTEAPPLAVSIRGGGFIFDLDHIAERGQVDPNRRFSYVGFRCVES